MNNAEFQTKLKDMCAYYLNTDTIESRTFNELVWMLRHDEVDCNISIPPNGEGNAWLSIPSVKECFIPVGYLAQRIKKVELDECADEDFEYDGICLTVWLED